MSLLYDEAPIAISPTLARVFGLNAAVFLQQVHYWIEQKKQHGSRYQDSYKDGQFWVYNTIDEWLEQLPFLGSKSTFKRILSELQAQGVLVSDNFNKRANDHTGWYRINYLRLQQIAESVNRSAGQNELPGRSKRAAGKVKMNRSAGQNEPSITKDYTETSTKTSQREDLENPLTPFGDFGPMKTYCPDAHFVEPENTQAPPPRKQPGLKDLPKRIGREVPPFAAPLPNHDASGFRDFWLQYPRRVARAQAVKAWDKLKPDAETQAQIMHDLAKRKQSDQQWLKDGGAFIPHPATYLNQGRWTDEIDISLPASNSAGNQQTRLSTSIGWLNKRLAEAEAKESGKVANQ